MSGHPSCPPNEQLSRAVARQTQSHNAESKECPGPRLRNGTNRRSGIQEIIHHDKIIVGVPRTPFETSVLIPEVILTPRDLLAGVSYAAQERKPLVTRNQSEPRKEERVVGVKKIKARRISDFHVHKNQPERTRCSRRRGTRQKEVDIDDITVQRREKPLWAEGLQIVWEAEQDGS